MEQWERSCNVSGVAVRRMILVPQYGEWYLCDRNASGLVFEAVRTLVGRYSTTTEGSPAYRAHCVSAQNQHLPSPSQKNQRLFVRWSAMSRRCSNCRHIDPRLTGIVLSQPPRLWCMRYRFCVASRRILEGIAWQNHIMRQLWLEEDSNKPIPGVVWPAS